MWFTYHHIRRNPFSICLFDRIGRSPETSERHHLIAQCLSIPRRTLAESLADACTEPMTSVSANATWYTQWREDSQAKASYVFVYNSSAYSTGSITFASAKIPYFYNSWTGDQIPVLQYTVTKEHTTIPL